MVTSNSSRDAALEEAQEWIRKGADLRARLLQERRALTERVRDIDVALAALPNEKKPEHVFIPFESLAARALIGDLNYAKMSAPELVKLVLSKHPEGASASTVVAEVKALRNDVDERNIHSALYRDGGIRKEGERGAMIYFLAEVTAK